MAAMVSEMVALAVSGVGVVESVTTTPKVKLPAALGALLSTCPGAALPTAEGFKVNPAGRVLPFARAKVYGGVPPVTGISAPYGTVPAPVGRVVEVKVSPPPAAALMVVESVVEALADPPPETVTEFTCGDVAVADTFTVTVIAG